MIRSRALRARAGRCGQRYGGLPPGATGAASQPGITPWPSALAPHSFTGDAGSTPSRGRRGQVSRAQVTSMVANTLARETLREALVATYVWGKGKSDSPGGSGPATLHKILAAEDLLDWRRG
ncbi:hypothetical protein ACFY2J_36715 [Streptomyces collinus]|uniref:8-oxoguanine DNA glycosylase OGG fold protein n=1 Tax=Streptomyces collinus TaxID=42684 RepID=UPI0036842CEB